VSVLLWQKHKEQFMPLPAFLIPLLKIGGSMALSAMANKGNRGNAQTAGVAPREEEPQVASIANNAVKSLQAETQEPNLLGRLQAFQDVHPFLTAGAGGALGGLMGGGQGAIAR
jgi:hypothetical protein